MLYPEPNLPRLCSPAPGAPRNILFQMLSLPGKGLAGHLSTQPSLSRCSVWTGPGYSSHDQFRTALRFPRLHIHCRCSLEVASCPPLLQPPAPCPPLLPSPVTPFIPCPLCIMGAYPGTCSHLEIPSTMPCVTIYLQGPPQKDDSPFPIYSASLNDRAGCCCQLVAVSSVGGQDHASGLLG